MARFKAERLSYDKQDELLDAFCAVLCSLGTKPKVKDFLKDLLNRQERMMLVRRLVVAERLAAGDTYRAIQERLHVGHGTIARVERWLEFGRGGYKAAIQTKRSHRT